MNGTLPTLASPEEGKSPQKRREGNSGQERADTTSAPPMDQHDSTDPKGPDATREKLTSSTPPQ